MTGVSVSYGPYINGRIKQYKRLAAWPVVWYSQLFSSPSQSWSSPVKYALYIQRKISEARRTVSCDTYGGRSRSTDRLLTCCP